MTAAIRPRKSSPTGDNFSSPRARSRRSSGADIVNGIMTALVGVAAIIGDAAADLHSGPPRCKQGAGALSLDFFTQHAETRRRGGRRDGERDRRHADPHRHRLRRSGCPIGIGAGLYLAEHRGTQAGQRRAVPGRRAQRAAIDRDGHLRLAVPRAAVRALLGAGRRRRARRDDDPARHAHDRGDGPLGPAVAARGGARARLSRAGGRRSPIVLRTATGRHRHGRARRGRAHRRRDGTAALHRVRQPVLVDVRSTQPIAALPLQIFTYAISPTTNGTRHAWAGALVLIGLVLVIISRRSAIAVRTRHEPASD